MSMSNDIQPVRFNMVDTVFFDKKSEDMVHISMILNGSYGEDNDITSLISKIKLPKEGKEAKEITVEKDKDGHLTWKVGEKEIKIGSSWWERAKHAVKSFFACLTDYKVTHEREVSEKVTRITDAFTAYVNKANADIQEQENLQLAQEAADRSAEEQRLALEAAAEDQRLALEAKVVDLNEKITIAIRNGFEGHLSNLAGQIQAKKDAIEQLKTELAASTPVLDDNSF